MSHYVCMILNQKGKLYVGISHEPDIRVGTHNANNGSVYTKNSNEFRIVFLEEYSTIQESRKREIQIKKWRRDKKEFLIEKYQSGLNTKI